AIRQWRSAWTGWASAAHPCTASSSPPLLSPDIQSAHTACGRVCAHARSVLPCAHEFLVVSLPQLMGVLAPVDWTIVVAYLALTLVVGALVSRSAGSSLESYFVASRSLPWWWLGTSMAATTFAADTPLVVSGLVARYGIAGNWFWWSWAMAHVAVAVVFAALWRRARVITDAELVEL